MVNTKIKRFFCFFIFVLSFLWCFSTQLYQTKYTNYFSVRSLFTSYSGILAIGCMSIIMLLAIRPAFLEKRLDGADKLYRLHKWLGITVLVVSTLHWLNVKIPHWLISWQLMARPTSRPPRVPADFFLFRFFQQQHHTAAVIGEWAFYVAAFLMVLALIKKIPYWIFIKTHYILAILYLLFVYHSIILIKFSYWTDIIAPVFVLLIGTGIFAAFAVLLDKAQITPNITGKISHLKYFSHNQFLQVDIQVDKKWPEHQIGQFAFLTFSRLEGHHPFSIASVWNKDERILKFLIKPLGDYTKKLPSRLKIGDKIVLEGPYGTFNFQNKSSQHQIWIAGGVGITPFIAGIDGIIHKQLNIKTVDLFYTLREIDNSFIDELQEKANRAGVRLHLINTSISKQRLDFELITKKIPNWIECDYWFCGPEGMQNAITSQLRQNGVTDNRLHWELFHMR